MSLASLARSFVRKSGFDVVRYVPELNQPFSVLPMLVRERMTRGEDFFFVQVGANDGVMDDPLRDLVREYHFAGLLIEPLPDLFEQLKHNYQGEAQLIFENVAILDREETVHIHRVRSDADVPEHWHGMAGFNRNNLLRQGVRQDHIETVPVRGTSLRGVLEKHHVSRISLLQVDTEGYDFEVIKMAFATGVHPDIINYEHCWLAPQTRLACKTMLNQRGYQFIEVGKDTLAVRATL